jgi:hypothetical protein
MIANSATSIMRSGNGRRKGMECRDLLARMNLTRVMEMQIDFQKS